MNYLAVMRTVDHELRYTAERVFMDKDLIQSAVRRSLRTCFELLKEVSRTDGPSYMEDFEWDEIEEKLCSKHSIIDLNKEILSKLIVIDGEFRKHGNMPEVKLTLQWKASGEPNSHILLILNELTKYYDVKGKLVDGCTPKWEALRDIANELHLLSKCIGYEGEDYDNWIPHYDSSVISDEKRLLKCLDSLYSWLTNIHNLRRNENPLPKETKGLAQKATSFGETDVEVKDIKNHREDRIKSLVQTIEHHQSKALEATKELNTLLGRKDS